ncbi:MAG: hypothetical protein WCC60_07195 [Ilumatobacteraceae bacterium]
MTMNEEERPRVGLFRGLAAVLRAVLHGFGTVLGLLGRGLAAVTRRSRRTAGDGDHPD